MGWEYHNRRRDYHGYFRRLGKSADLHIRVTEKQHAAIRARATATFKDISEYVLYLVQQDLLTANGEKMCTHREQKTPERETVQVFNREIYESRYTPGRLQPCPGCDKQPRLIYREGPGNRAAYEYQCPICGRLGPEAIFYLFDEKNQLVKIDPSAPISAAGYWNCMAFDGEHWKGPIRYAGGHPESVPTI